MRHSTYLLVGGLLCAACASRQPDAAATAAKPAANVAAAPAPPRAASAPAAGGTVVLANGLEIKAIDGTGHLRRLEEIENDLIRFAIELYDGHMTEVARRLGIGRSTLYRKLREMGLGEPPPLAAQG